MRVAPSLQAGVGATEFDAMCCDAVKLGILERNSIPFSKILPKILPSFEICLNFKLPY